MKRASKKIFEAFLFFDDIRIESRLAF